MGALLESALTMGYPSLRAHTLAHGGNDEHDDAGRHGRREEDSGVEDRESGVSRRAKVHQDPIAVTSSGDLLVNVGLFDGVTTLEEILRRAKRARAEVFIGVTVEDEEVPLVADRVRDACREAAAFIEGERRRKRRKRKARPR